MEQLLREAFGKSEYIGDIRGRGLFWCLEFVEDTASKTAFPADLGFGSKVQLATFEWESLCILKLEL